MFVYANGDEFTFGAKIGLDEKSGQVNHVYRQNNNWVAKLAKHLGADNYHTAAAPAATNVQIAISTMDWINRNYIFPGKPVDDLFVVIGWSAASRYETVNERGERTIFQPGDWNRVPAESTDIDGLFSPSVLAMNWLTQVIALQGFLTKYGINHLFFNTVETPHPFHFGFGNVLGALDHTKCYHFYENRKNMSSMLKAVGKDPHSEEGHAFWALTLHTFMTKPLVRQQDINQRVQTIIKDYIDGRKTPPQPDDTKRVVFGDNGVKHLDA